ncbi:hypothetical protein ABIF38_008804 [Bradyrhizobium japonicum]|nr:hypothetical protein [Bradyrhizobium elkanii]MCS3452323.1 hypothetical protein [Bradyrhizobium elkanii]MCS3565574.1 hypothetical protein [Bradyrhizobium elkanii]MCS3573004.1 hypothetical protein [Bradyrhizobium elkanii]MCS3594303.1 hypothetical protein [Bradyrhizobium elkanii]
MSSDFQAAKGCYAFLAISLPSAPRVLGTQDRAILQSLCEPPAQGSRRGHVGHPRAEGRGPSRSFEHVDSSRLGRSKGADAAAPVSVGRAASANLERRTDAADGADRPHAGGSAPPVRAIRSRGPRPQTAALRPGPPLHRRRLLQPPPQNGSRRHPHNHSMHSSASAAPVCGQISRAPWKRGKCTGRCPRRPAISSWTWFDHPSEPDILNRLPCKRIVDPAQCNPWLASADFEFRRKNGFHSRPVLPYVTEDITRTRTELTPSPQLI